MKRPCNISATLAGLLLTAALAASCTKIHTLPDNDPQEIAMNPVASNVTRTVPGPVSDGYSTEETMGIMAFYSEEEGSWVNGTEDVTEYINKSEFKYNESYGMWAGWDGTKHSPHYWPLSGSLIFAGYSPFRDVGDAPIDDVSFDLQSKTLSISGYEADQSDLMYFLPQSDVYGNYVGVRGTDYNALFHHALSLVVFTARVAKSDDIDYIRLKRIVLSDIVSAGDFSAQMSNVPNGNVTWIKASDASVSDCEVFAQVTAGGRTLTISPETIVEYLAIPLGTHDIIVEYSLIVNGKPHVESVNFKGQWETGKKYIYNLILGTESIELDPQITSDWGN